MAMAVEFGAEIGNIRIEATVFSVAQDVDIVNGRDIFIFSPNDNAHAPCSFYIYSKWYTIENQQLKYLIEDISEKLK